MSMNSMISIIVPVCRVYLDVYRSFWQQLGCLVEAQEQSSYCTITFPEGTVRERRPQTQEPRFLLRLPDQTTVEEVRGRNCSYLYTSQHDQGQLAVAGQ